MNIVAGIDIGNATTETAIAQISEQNTKVISSGIVKTTGVKGTSHNIPGVYASLKQALQKVNLEIKDLEYIKINEAAPVIGDVAMDTITETIITESTMIGHNPDTPGGIGLGCGITVNINKIGFQSKKEPYILIIPKEIAYDQGAKKINNLLENGYNIAGIIAQADDGVLISNRLSKNIPIVDEVLLIDNIPENMKAAVEVAKQGTVIEQLSNPYGIATIFELNSEETRYIVPVSRALIGNRSAVVIKTPQGDVKERIIPAGYINFIGMTKERKVEIDQGAKEIMKVQDQCMPIKNIVGQPGSNVGGMLEKIRQVMSELTGRHPKEICIQDILAVDTLAPQKIVGGLALEYSMESAVGLAAMVKSDKLQMTKIAKELEEKLGKPVFVGGVEADMAIKGALTTPGTSTPIAIIDMGAGSTDASYLSSEGNLKSIHLAGAGNMVSLLIQTELGLEDFDLAEDIKKYPLAKVESMFHIRHEDGSVDFYQEPLDPKLFARVIILKENDKIPIPTKHSLEKIKAVRQGAKKKVFVENTKRALNYVSPSGTIKDIAHVVMVGGSALDFEIPQMVTNELSNYNIVAGRGNIRGKEGPRNAVATGLLV